MHIVLGLLVAFVMVAFFVWRNKDTRSCRWRADHTGDKDGKFKYRCMACGAEGFSDTDAPPKICVLKQHLD